MSLRRLDDDETWDRPDRPPCGHREHAPPAHVVLPSGRYEHVCPGCGRRTVFVVARPVWDVPRGREDLAG